MTYPEVRERLYKRKCSKEGLLEGIGMFVFGLGLKVLLANRLGGLWEDVQTIGFDSISTPLAWMSIFAFTFQLYFDFFGYSVMAIGLGKMLGFDFVKNFDYPYISRSATEFWRRWHISMGSFFRDYVYIPMGGNRRHQFVNLFVVWFLTGLWHGASWNFVLWGLYYAVLLIIEKLFLLKLLGKLPKFIGHVYAMVAVVLGWSLFYFEDITRLGGFLGQLFTPAAVTVQGGNLILGYLPMLLISAVAATPLLSAIGKKLESKAWTKWVKMALLAVVFLLCVAALASDSYNPFIYFRF